jgi:hypothetical protein
MVDYNIAIPQQQLFQAPDMMQNAMRMQQMQTQGASAESANQLRAMQTRGLEQGQQLTAIQIQAAKQNMAAAAATARAQAAARAEALSDKNALANAMKRDVVGLYGPQERDLNRIANTLDAEGRFNPAATVRAAINAATESGKKKADLDKTKEETSKITAENLDKEFVMFKTLVPTVRTPQDAGLWKAAMYDNERTGKVLRQMGLTREQVIAQAEQQFADDPKLWTATNLNITGQQAISLLTNTQKETDLGGQISTQEYDPFNRPVGDPTMLAKTMTPKEAASIETPEQKLAYQADLQKQKARVDLELALPAAKSSVDATIGDIDAQIARVKNLREHKGLQYITGGIMGRIGSTGKEATSAQADLDQIIAKAGFDALQQMRNASPTGGALGNVSDREGKRLEASAAAMSQAQGTKAFKDKLDRFMADLERAKKSIKSAFDAQYAGVKSAPAKSDGWTIEEN